MMMLFVMGGPSMQRFSGGGSEAKLGEWKLQIETILSFQPLSDSQKADLVLGLLEGEAKREILTLDRTSRNTPKKIFHTLLVFYTHVSTLRIQFLSCRQEQQSLRSFSLHLRELFSRLKRREATGLGGAHVLLWDQFIMGLREGPICQEQSKTPTLFFDKVKMEALVLEEEQDEQWPPSTCFAVGKQTPNPQPTVTDWKKEFRNEILKEVRQQMTEMTKTILSELRDSGRQDTYSPQIPHQRIHTSNTNGYKNGWPFQI